MRCVFGILICLMFAQSYADVFQGIEFFLPGEKREWKFEKDEEGLAFSRIGHEEEFGEAFVTRFDKGAKINKSIILEIKKGLEAEGDQLFEYIERGSDGGCIFGVLDLSDNFYSVIRVINTNDGMVQLIFTSSYLDESDITHYKSIRVPVLKKAHLIED